MSQPIRYIHASAVLIGERAVLLRGASGIGKSTLARSLVADAAHAGRFAQLVGDDRVGLFNRSGRLIAVPHPAIAGRIEWHGHGIVAASHAAAGVVGLVVDIVASIERMPDTAATATLEGVDIPCLTLAAREPHAAALILSML